MSHDDLRPRATYTPEDGTLCTNVVSSLKAWTDHTGAVMVLIGERNTPGGKPRTVSMLLTPAQVAALAQVCAQALANATREV